MAYRTRPALNYGRQVHQLAAPSGWRRSHRPGDAPGGGGLRHGGDLARAALRSRPGRRRPVHLGPFSPRIFSGRRAPSVAVAGPQRSTAGSSAAISHRAPSSGASAAAAALGVWPVVCRPSRQCGLSPGGGKSQSAGRRRTAWRRTARLAWNGPGDAQRPRLLLDRRPWRKGHRPLRVGHRRDQLLPVASPADLHLHLPRALTPPPPPPLPHPPLPPPHPPPPLSAKPLPPQNAAWKKELASCCSVPIPLPAASRWLTLAEHNWLTLSECHRWDLSGSTLSP